MAARYAMTKLTTLALAAGVALMGWGMVSAYDENLSRNVSAIVSSVTQLHRHYVSVTNSGDYRSAYGFFTPGFTDKTDFAEFSYRWSQIHSTLGRLDSYRISAVNVIDRTQSDAGYVIEVHFRSQFRDGSLSCGVTHWVSTDTSTLIGREEIIFLEVSPEQDSTSNEQLYQELGCQ